MDLTHVALKPELIYGYSDIIVIHMVGSRGNSLKTTEQQREKRKGKAGGQKEEIRTEKVDQILSSSRTVHRVKDFSHVLGAVSVVDTSLKPSNGVCTHLKALVEL